MENTILKSVCTNPMLIIFKRLMQIPSKIFAGYDTHYYIISTVATIKTEHQC